ncbi:MAG: isoprenylcysteine carboxylmethyltransferase family protein [Acidobacteriota bacterium]
MSTPKREFESWLIAIWGLAAYASMAASMLALAALMIGLWPQPVAVPPGSAIGINLTLLVLFGIQHSVMARSWFKRWSPLPESMERSGYVLVSSLALIAVCWLWRPLDGMAWRIDHGVARFALHLGFVVGLGWTVVSTFLIDHAHFVGLRQALAPWRGTGTSRDLEFQTPGLYRIVRHPMMTGTFLVLWSTPEMSWDRLLLALGLSVYIRIGVIFEERDLVRTFGLTYRAYQRTVPMLVPGLRPRIRRRVAV